MKKYCLIPGSFDPITIGHLDIIKRASKNYDKVIVGIGINPSKTYMFSVNERIEKIKEMTKDISNVEVYSYSNLTVEFAKSKDCKYIVKGIRNIKDLKYELYQKRYNKKLDKSIKTIFYLARFKYRKISSTIVRNNIKQKG